MMIHRSLAFFAALLASLSFSACAIAQVDFDPTAPDAVVVYGGPDPLTIETANGPVNFTVEVADTQEARQRGMMHRDSLAPDAGMLFDFQFEQVVSIWMDNTRIPLDIIFIRSDGTIAKIVANAVPYSRRSMYSDFRVISVLEIAGGRSAELGIAPGDLVRHSLFGTAQASVEPEAETAEPPQAADGEPAEPPGEGG